MRPKRHAVENFKDSWCYGAKIFDHKISALLKIYKATSRAREVKLIDFANHNTDLSVPLKRSPKVIWAAC